MSIRVRIALLGSGVVALALLLFGVLLYALVAYGLDKQQNQTLMRLGRQLDGTLHGANAEQFVPRPSLAPVDLKSSAETFVELLGPSGAPITGTGEADGGLPRIDAGLLHRAEAAPVLATMQLRSGLQLRVYVRTWQRPDLGLNGFLVAGQSRFGVRTQLRGLRNFLYFSGFFTLIAAFGASWFAPGQALRPLKTMARTADAIGRTHDLSRRLPESRSHDEVALLSTSFNGMLSRLDAADGQLQEAYRCVSESLAAQNRFVADASHELRTPLTTIRNNAGFLHGRPDAHALDRQAALQDIAAESERMSRLVQSLLDLARADAGRQLERSRLDLRALVETVCRQARTAYPRRQVDLESGGPVEVDGNADALTQLLWIVLDNAARHTDDGGRIHVQLGSSGGGALLLVSDNGSGIPEAELERVFARFYRADAARNGGGAGLGLSIARWIVQQHGGTIVACNNAGIGATFTVELPTAELPVTRP